MNRYLIVSLAVALSIILLFWSVEKPRPENEPVPAGAVKSAGQSSAQRSSPEALKKKAEERSYSKLEARNIFAADGAYALSSEQKTLGGASITLLGVIGGKAKTAIFRDSTGAIVSVAEGEPLANGAIVTAIDRSSVIAQRGAEKREFVIFDMKGRLPRSGGG